jgi:hypothetical protein
MARVTARPPAGTEQVLDSLRHQCWHCGGPLWVAYYSRRTVVTLDGLVALRLAVRRCEAADCAGFHRPYRPEAEGRLALPQAEFGLDVIALVGRLRFAECRSVPEIHGALRDRGVAIAERSVTNLVARYEELVALALADAPARAAALRAQGAIVLALDGLQPDVGHEVLWVLRDVLSGTILLARSLLGATARELAGLLREVLAALPAGVAVRGVVSDGQRSIRTAARTALPGVPHQLCHFHYLREAGLPIYEADRHAKKELKKQVRGVRPIERSLEGRRDAEADAVHGYCQAVRSAITDDGRPPLAASGLKLHERLTAIHTSLTHVADGVAERGGRRPRRSPASRPS